MCVCVFISLCHSFIDVLNGVDVEQALNNLGSVFRISGHIKSSLEHYLLAAEVSMSSEEGSISSMALNRAKNNSEASPLDLYTIGR